MSGANASIADRPLALADEVARLQPPSQRDPERYWRDRSNRATALRRVADQTRSPH